MSTLLLRCAGPMQSWGTRSRFTERDTEREPSKSGVIGLLCAALGRPREAPVDDLTALRMGVRVDAPGSVQRDYQTTLAVAKASGAKPDTLPSNRYYLADAAFIVGFEGPTKLLVELDAALRAPRYPLALGRRAFVPGYPVAMPPGAGVVDKPLVQALIEAPYAGRSKAVELVLDDTTGEGAELRQDVPLSLVKGARRFAARRVVRESHELLGGG